MSAHQKLDPSAEVLRVVGAGPRSTLKKLVPALLTLLVLGVLTVGVILWRKNQAAAGTVFESALVQRSDIQVTVRATGTLQTLTTVEVGAEVTGRLLKVNVETNDVVKRGQVLAEIDPEQLRAAVEQSAAQVISSEAAILLAKATLTESQASFQRSQRMLKEGVASQSEAEASTAGLGRAEANLKSAKANASLAQASLRSAQSRLGKTTIVSPIDGVVLSKLVEPGQTVTAGFSTPVLFRLAQDLTRMRLTVDVDEADVGRVHEGARATFTVEAYPERSFESRVLSLYNEPKTSQNVVTYQAVLEVDNESKLLKPGMTCTATIISETRPHVLSVPNAALRFTPPAPPAGTSGAPKKTGQAGDKSHRVWVPSPNGPVAITLRIGATDGTRTEIIEPVSGLSEGKPVLVDVKEPH